MAFEIRPIVEDEFSAFLDVNNIAFGQRPSPDHTASARKVIEFDRTLAAFDGGEIVGTAGVYSCDLTLPNMNTLPVAGVSWVGVLPTHRRRGLLRQLMVRQLSDIRQRGAAIAILTASEGSIYGRFGYGLATSYADYQIDRIHAGLRESPDDATGRVRLVEQEEAARFLPALHDRARRLRAGAITRNDGWWSAFLSSPQGATDGQGARFIAVYEDLGKIDGVVIYRINRRWENGLAVGELSVRESIATTPIAYRRLWQYCLDIDLTASVQASTRPLDEPLRYMLADPRRLRVTHVGDDLWVRLIDIERALTVRGYSGEGKLTLRVHDSFIPELAGFYELDARLDGAVCRHGSGDENRAGDLEMDVSTLGAAYLGGVSFSTLCQAGRVVEHRRGAAALADRLFSVASAPYCGTGF